MADETTDSPLDAAVDLHALDDLTFEGRPTVLDRLGPAHFRSKGFSFMGFLQTVYDHVAQHAQTKAAPATLASESGEAIEPVASAPQAAETPESSETSSES